MKNRKSRKNRTFIGTLTVFKTVFFLTAFALGFSMLYGGKSLAAGLDGTTLMYALDKVNVRSGPGTDTDIIGELEQGETIFAVELTEEGWYRVVFEGDPGYIRQDFLEVYGTEGDWSGRDLSEYEAIYDAEEEGAETEPVTEEEPDEAEAPEEPEKPKKNIAPLLVIIVVLAAIIIYSGIQIMQERRQSGQDDDEDEDQYEDGDGIEYEDENQYEDGDGNGNEIEYEGGDGNGNEAEDSDILELAWEIEEEDES